MGDETQREAERLSRSTGGVEDRARLLMILTRQGRLSEHRLELAAYLGDATARALCPQIVSTIEMLDVLGEELGPLPRWSRETLALLCFAGAIFRLRSVPPGIGGRDDPFARVQHAFRSLQRHFRSPSESSVEEVAVGSGGAGAAGWGDHEIRGQPGLPEAQRADNAVARSIELACMLIDPVGENGARTALSSLRRALWSEDRSAFAAFVAFARDEVAPWILGETDPTDRWLESFAEQDVDPRAARAPRAPTGRDRLRAAFEQFDMGGDLSVLVLDVTRALQAPIPERSSWRLDVMRAWLPLRLIELGDSPREGLAEACERLRALASPGVTRE